MTAAPPGWIRPGDPDFERAVAALSASAWQPPRAPAAVVAARAPDDVVLAVERAAARGHTVTVRSGGHSLSAAHVADDAVAIDLRRLDRIEIDGPSATAWIEPGATVAQAALALDRAGMSFPIGHAPTVGLGGYLLAGGNGWNTPQWGHGCERVLTADVVLPDGQRRIVDHDHDPDLWRAVRGAGPMFPGVVLRFHVRLVRGAARARRAFATVVADAPARLGDTIDALLTELPPAVETTVFWRPATAHRPAPEATIALTAFDVSLRIEDALERHGLRHTSTGPLSLAAIVAGLPRHEGDALASDHVWTEAPFAQVLPRLPHRGEMLTDRSSILLTTAARRADGGLPPDALYAPSGTLSVSPYAHWDPRLQPARPQVAWTRQVTAGLTDLTTGHYLGEADLTSPRDAVVRCLTPGSRARLREVLGRHDPSQRMAWTARAQEQLERARRP